MRPSIEQVVVIGAGTMGAAIACHVANAGRPVLLLDIVPRELTPDEERKGLTLEHPAVRGRIVREGFERIARLKPASLMSRQARSLVRLGTLEDDLDQVAEADWIVEAIVERLDVKRQLMERLDAVRGEGAIVTTNTSGLPIAHIVQGRSDGFRRHFFGTHFFNPPRYMKLLEIIRGAETDPAAVERIADFANRKLGKGVVFCKDTPNFIGNRILSIHGGWAMDYAVRHGYRFEEVDAVTGPLIGRPKTAMFRLQDLVGIDIAHGVGQNLHDLIPEDPHREVLKSESLGRIIAGLFERGRFGNKTGSGFYRRSKGRGGKPVFEVLDPQTFDYEPQQEVGFPCLAAARIPDLGERLRAVLRHAEEGDRGAELAWQATAHLLSYAAERGPDIAFDLESIDRAVRWGFSYELGPFELWDLLGVAETAERMTASGHTVASWVKAMLEAGNASFYRREGDAVTGAWSWQSQSYQELESDPRHLAVAELHRRGQELEANASASLLDLGDGVLLAELHTKMNAIDDAVVALLQRAAEHLESGEWRGLVIGNDGENFCVGANLKRVIEAAKAGRFDDVRGEAKALQDALLALRDAPAPVVAAVHGMALGGGCEIAMAANRVVAHAESYLGLVESGVGLVPGAGGLKELVRRILSRAMAVPQADPLPVVQQILETVAMAKVSSSAAEAVEMGFLAADDRIVMNRDHLLLEAKAEVLAMAERFTPPAAVLLYAGGRDLRAALRVAVWSLEQAGWASEHDALVAGKIAGVLTGGDLTVPTWLGEEHFLRLEREAFAELLATEKTQERIVHMLKTGKPLRN